MAHSETGAIGAHYHALRASIYLAARDYRKAEAAARAALHLEPFHGPGYFFLGRILLVAGNAAAETDTLRELQRVDADAFSPDYEFWTLLLEAEIELSEGNPGRALQKMDEAMALPPEVGDRQWRYLSLAR